MRIIEPAPTVRATYLLVKCLEERIIATYLLLLQQLIHYFSFCGNLLASPTLCVHPVIPEIKAHRIILSACSSIFKEILQINTNNNHPIIYLRGIQHPEMESVLQFIFG